MARGWESKSVESQQDDRERSARDRRAAAPSAAEAETAGRRRTVELALARARADLAGARSPAHRASLEQAIAALTAQLASLK